MVKYSSKKANTVDGMSLNIPKFHDIAKNINTTETSNFCLTDVTKLNDLLKIEIPISQYPEQFTTSLLCNSYPTITNSSCYLYVIEETVSKPTRDYTLGEDADAMTWIWAQDTSQNPIYFTVTLHDETTLSINHNDNTDNVYMSYDQEAHSIVFKTVPFDLPTDNEKFEYFINNDQGFVLIYKKVSDQVYYLRPNANQNTILLQSAGEAGTATLPIQNVFKFVVYRKNSLIHDLQNNWVSYQTSGSFNNLNVNKTKSYFDVTNNYLFNYQFRNIDDEGNVPVQLTQLKNQVTITGDMNRENPFPNMRDCDHRDYTSIYTSDDNNGIHLGYESYEAEITLEPDKITYFNTPQDMYPYKKLNINDSGLMRRGAIGGDTPLTSDKIFKKAATYKYNTPNGKPTDEESGMWLCSWLKSNLSTDWEESIFYNENVFVDWEGEVYKCRQSNKGLEPDLHSAYWERTDQPPPVWVDRYYNPAKYTVLEALEFEGQYSSYRPKFDHIIDVLEAEDSYVFDKISDLTFEPGCLYAYYRIGSDQVRTIIDNISDSIVHTGLEPAYKQDRTPFVNIEQDVMKFTGEQYIESSRLNKFDNNDFTISFNMSMPDWSQPVGTQIIGNYTNHGVGIFNKRETTPYIIFKGSDKVYICNTNVDPVLILNDEAGVIDVTKQLGNEDLIIYNSLSANTYDTKGMLVETTTPAGFLNYRNENKQVYITSLKPGIPRGIIRLKHAWEFDKTIDVIVQEWNDENPDFQIILSGEGSEWEFEEGKTMEDYMDGTGIAIRIPWIPDQDIIVTPNDLESPAGKIIAADVDNNYKYILDEYDSIFRFDLNTEAHDLLNRPYPFDVILGRGEVELSTGEEIVFETSDRMFIKSVNEGEYQYILDCDNYTIDMYDQPWFTKGNVVYKYTLSEQLGINASWQDVIVTEDWTQSGEALLVATNNYNGSLGNEIKLLPDGIKTLNTLVNEHNALERSNTLNIVEGDPSMIPVKYLKTGERFVIQLDGGVDRGSTTTSIAFSASDYIDNIKCDTDNNMYIFHGNKITKTDYLRNKLASINITDYINEAELLNFDQKIMDLVTEFDQDNVYATHVLILIRDTDNENVHILRLNSDDLSLISYITKPIDVSVNLNEQNNITSYETFKQLCRETIDSNYLTFQIRYQSYFDTDKTSVKKLSVDVSELTPGKHHFAFAYNSNNSNLSLFIDGVLTVAESSDDSASGAAYKFSKTIQAPLLVGAEPFFNNITFAEHLNVSNYGFCSGFDISNYRVFNEYVNFQKIKMLSREGKDIQPMKITIPGGKRNYVEHIDKFFKHKEPGGMSNKFNINITCEALTGTDLQQLINEELVQKLQPIIPINTEINNINWIT